MKVVALAGGVGGAKLADGLASSLHPDDLKVIVNTGDDFSMYGLAICPDLDTVCYTLAGLANPRTGWGLQGDSFHTFEALQDIGGNPWFRLGDRDLATHMERTRLLAEGETLSRVTRRFCDGWGIRMTVLPMSDDPIRTIVHTDDYGELPFQEYFVKYGCDPKVNGFHFLGIEAADPAPGVIEAILSADLVVICPSNPWVSIQPILSVHGVLESLNGKKVVAISPIIGGKTIKGPAAKMYSEMGLEPSALSVALHYKSFLGGFVMDLQDEPLANEVTGFGIIPFVTDTVMKTQADRRRLAEEVLRFGQSEWRVN